MPNRAEAYGEQEGFGFAPGDCLCILELQIGQRGRRSAPGLGPKPVQAAFGDEELDRKAQFTADLAHWLHECRLAQDWAPMAATNRNGFTSTEGPGFDEGWLVKWALPSMPLHSAASRAGATDAKPTQ